MYVGKSIPQSIYKTKLKGTDADVGETTGIYVSSHYSHAAALGIGGEGWALVNKGYYGHGSKFKVFRCTKPENAKYRAGKIIR